MIVWVHLPELKIHFYHKEVLTTLGNLIGRTIKLDYHTLTQQRAKFARLAVEVDLSRPLVPRIWLDDDWQPVEYENLPVVCFECGKIGHSSASCPLLRPAPVPTVANTPAGGHQASPEVAPEPNAGFGPWMLVTRKGRRNQSESNNKGKEKVSGNLIKAKEKVLGNSHHENAEKIGKGALKIRDLEAPLPVVTQQPSALLQRASNQIRKDNGGKQSGGERRNGKEALIEEGPPIGRGLLGPGPSKGAATKKGQPKSEGLSASSSSTKQPTLSGLPSRPNGESSSGPHGQDSPKAPLLFPSSGPHGQDNSKARPISPPPTLVSTGPNGTVLQVIQVPSQDEGQQRRSDLSSPSTANRTKGKKSSKGRSKKGSPAKLSPVRPLQIWSPMKDRKAKSKSRMASLTLQEISAWTEAAQSATTFPAVKGLSSVPPPPSSQRETTGDPAPSSVLTGGSA
ncbi:unnamed protein product [Linum trigynum]|uniref:CCHC-type domain-containing protein n=1 Tax=Linum trigynum TaxID=586398 RepID=A0AAV2CU85_9ROSI